MKAADALRDPCIKAKLDGLAVLLADYECRSQGVSHGAGLNALSGMRFFDDLADRFGVALTDAVGMVEVEPFAEWCRDQDVAQAADR